jgi:hypothetical protein
MGSNPEENLEREESTTATSDFCFPACIGCTILAGINPAALAE